MRINKAEIYKRHKDVLVERAKRNTYTSNWKQNTVYKTSMLMKGNHYAKNNN